MILSVEEILLILNRLQLDEVFVDGAFVVCKKSFGYSAEPAVSALQAKLSVMLEMSKSRPSTPEERKVFNAALKRGRPPKMKGAI